MTEGANSSLGRGFGGKTLCTTALGVAVRKKELNLTTQPCCLCVCSTLRRWDRLPSFG